MRVDAHQHFWDLSRGDYGWLTPSLEPLYRDYLPADIKPFLDEAEIEATVLVQAAPTLEETQYLLGLADEFDFIKAVIGWVDFEASNAPRVISELARHKRLKGLRPMIQDIDDLDWMLRPKLRPAFEVMIEYGLRLDALVKPEHLKNLDNFIRMYPDLKVVIDHGAKPSIATGDFGEWARDMSALAKHKHVFCKLSGLWTEAGGRTGRANIGSYVDHLFLNFGPNRLMWGSDWPVLRLAGAYQDWFGQCQEFMAELPGDVQADIMGGNARRFYDF